jgi:hypothetical protein
VLERDAEREAARWETGSVADALTGLAAEDPDWATVVVVVEQSRRRRTDPTFHDRWARRTTLVRNALGTLVHHERGAGHITSTIPDEVAARFISVVGDGLLQRAILGEVPHVAESSPWPQPPSPAGGRAPGTPHPHPAASGPPEGERRPAREGGRGVVHTPDPGAGVVDVTPLG